MDPDINNEFRAILKKETPAFDDRVDTLWEQVPDFENYNMLPYLRIESALKDLRRTTYDKRGSKTQGVLILGEAGTGKTHLLNRVARNLGKTNQILYIRKPNNEDAVAQHIWANVVNSLAITNPYKTSKRSQLDDLLAYVFTAVLIPQFEQDIHENKDADQKRRWIDRLKTDPYNLFNMLGDGVKRQENLDRVRKRTLNYLQSNHPDVDQTIARVLITYCLVNRDNRKRVLMNWLAGQDIDETEAKDLGIPSSWVTLDETSSDASTQQKREDQALRAIRTVGILSTYYQPLILAFDQLEGLRDQQRLTNNWGDVLREIFTMAPNFLVITCIFPSLWESWFVEALDQSVRDRIAQQVLHLDTFAPQDGFDLLAEHLKPSFVEYRLPTNIFPFTDQDVQRLCQKATTPRKFIQEARREFQSWLYGNLAAPEPVRHPTTKTVTQEDIEEVINKKFADFEKSVHNSFASEMVLEQDFFGRIRSLLETLLFSSGNSAEFGKATCRHFVMPPNVIIRHPGRGASLCLAVMNSEGTSFTARMRNLNKCLQDGNQFTHLMMIRDLRCKQLGAKGQEQLDEAKSKGSSYIQIGQDDMMSLNAVYDILVAVEERDLMVGDRPIDKRQVAVFLRNERVLSRIELFQHAGRYCPPLAEVIGLEVAQLNPPPPKPVNPPLPVPQHQPTQAPKDSANPLPPPTPKPQKVSKPVQKAMVDVVIGDEVLESPHVGMLGELRDGRKKLGISLTKPQCLVLLGYMGSGKSYALGVLIENALLMQQGLIEQSRPMCVVAFNYRRNPHSRFEYGGFAKPNSKSGEIKTLAQKYSARPQAVETVNVFGYQEELPRRVSEYGELKSFPIQFRSNELQTKHWEILMKPPSSETEYMNIIRDIIQKLYYKELLTFKHLEQAIQTDERLSKSQRRQAFNRLSFAAKWISDNRPYEWADVLQEGSLNIFDLRIQAMEASEALKLCLIVTDLVRSTKNGVNKMVVFDEAHEYVDCKELVGELENAITQIRHEGLVFVLASQFPERIPETIFKYLLTRLIFKLPTAKAINYVRNAAPNLQSLSSQKVSTLEMEQGVCFIQTDEGCTDPLMKVPQLLEVRPRCTMHGGSTIRQTGTVESEHALGTANAEVESEFEELEAELCPVCGEELVLKRGRSGVMMVCTTYPKCRFTRQA